MAALAASENSESTCTIVRYYSAWIEDEYICIQMELCETSVEHLIAPPNFLTEADVFCVLRDILLALRTLHRLVYIHIDMYQFANILIFLFSIIFLEMNLYI